MLPAVFQARVCPLKARTLPELELEGAKLVAQLLAHTAEVLHIPLTNCFCWSNQYDCASLVAEATQQTQSIYCQ